MFSAPFSSQRRGSTVFTGRENNYACVYGGSYRGSSGACDPLLSEMQWDVGQGRAEECGGILLNSSAGPAAVMSNSKKCKKAVKHDCVYSAQLCLTLCNPLDFRL